MTPPKMPHCGGKVKYAYVVSSFFLSVSCCRSCRWSMGAVCCLFVGGFFVHFPPCCFPVFFPPTQSSSFLSLSLVALTIHTHTHTWSLLFLSWVGGGLEGLGGCFCLSCCTSSCHTSRLPTPIPLRNPILFYARGTKIGIVNGWVDDSSLGLWKKKSVVNLLLSPLCCVACVLFPVLSLSLSLRFCWLIPYIHPSLPPPPPFTLGCYERGGKRKAGKKKKKETHRAHSPSSSLLLPPPSSSSTYRPGDGLALLVPAPAAAAAGSTPSPPSPPPPPPPPTGPPVFPTERRAEIAAAVPSLGCCLVWVGWVGEGGEEEEEEEEAGAAAAAAAAGAGGSTPSFLSAWGGCGVG